MRSVPSPVLLRAMSLLLPLAIFGWVSTTAFPSFSSSDEPVHIYTWREYYLQIHPDGRVDSSSPQTVYSALLIKPVSAENVVIISAKTGLNLCMHSDGSLFGSPSFSNRDCLFKHTLLENRYDIYESVTHRFLLSLGQVKAPLHPNRDTPPFSQFLKRKNEIPLDQIYPLRHQPDEPNYSNTVSCLDATSGEIRDGTPGDENCLPLG